MTLGTLLLVILWRCKRPSKGTANSTLCYSNAVPFLIQDQTTFHSISVKPPEEPEENHCRYIAIQAVLLL